MFEAEIDTTLAAAAFGSEPATWPLPTAATPHQLWLRAVAAGGQGRYASAASDLATLLRNPSAGPLVSLAQSTQGSFLRQLGWHTVARGWDGRAVALACDDLARADALIGLAADALGIGRFVVSAALLARVAGLLDSELAGAGLPGASGTPGTSPQRLAVRRAWVTAELAMATGDGVAAVRHAQQALDLITSTEMGSARHRLKSDVVLAAALCSAGRVDRARGVADAALDTAGRLGLIPLRWALACLLADIGSATQTAQQIVDIRDSSAELVRRRGGNWRIR